MGQFKILRRIRDGGSGVPEFLNNRGEEWVFETREAAQSEVVVSTANNCVIRMRAMC